MVKRDEALVGANGVVSQIVDDEITFVGAHAERISRETRKVLRLASWDLRGRFKTAMDERGKEVKGAEDVEKKAKRAVEKFREIERRAGEVREVAELVNSA